MSNQVRSVRQPSGHSSGILLFILALSLSVLSILPSVAASAPSAPQYVEAMAGPTQVAVTWDTPSSTGGESLNYTARVWTLPPPTSSPVFASCSTTGLGCLIGGLVTGTTYYVDVTATNSAGASGPSASKSISPGNAGSPPSNVSATSDSTGRVTIKWTPPTALGTGQFAWYTAEVFTGPEISAGAYTSYCTADPASATSCFIGGLKLGTTYYVQVRTVSSLGSSYPSSPRFIVVAGTATSAKPSASPSAKPSASPSVKPSALPSATKSKTTTPAVKFPEPEQVKAVLHGKSVQVSWKAPAIKAGMKIIGYTVEVSHGMGDMLRGFKGVISTYKMKPLTNPIGFSCALSIGNAGNYSVLVQVFALYSSGAKVGSRFVAVRLPN